MKIYRGARRKPATFTKLAKIIFVVVGLIFFGLLISYANASEVRWDVVVVYNNGKSVASFPNVDHVLIKGDTSRPTVLHVQALDTDDEFTYPVPGHGIWAVGVDEKCPERHF